MEYWMIKDLSILSVITLSVYLIVRFLFKKSIIFSILLSILVFVIGHFCLSPIGGYIPY